MQRMTYLDHDLKLNQRLTYNDQIFEENKDTILPSMKGWKPTDEPEFPYYYPATTTYHSKIKRSGCHQGDNHFCRNRSHASDMTQFEYHTSGGKCNISDHAIILILI